MNEKWNYIISGDYNNSPENEAGNHELNALSWLKKMGVDYNIIDSGDRNSYDPTIIIQLGDDSRVEVFNSKQAAFASRMQTIN